MGSCEVTVVIDLDHAGIWLFSPAFVGAGVFHVIHLILSLLLGSLVHLGGVAALAPFKGDSDP